MKTRARLGRYENLVLLGEGGMGAVYRAFDPQLDREVALKVMNDRSADFIARFRREARAMARLSHPRIAQVYDFGEDEDGAPYFVMELVPGRSLDALIQQRGPLPPRLVCDLLLQAAEGLGAAHAAGIVHRDVKPANLMLGEAGGLKLVDFGIARLEEGAGALTRPQALLGTPQYMAPEVLAGKPADGRADIYALGLTGHHLLTGRPPFEAPSAAALAMKQLSEPLPDLQRAAPGTPPALARLIERMAEKDREARIGSCEEVARALRQLLPTFAQGKPPRRLPVPVLSGGAAVLLLGSALGLRLARRPAAEGHGAALSREASPQRGARPTPPISAAAPASAVAAPAQTARAAAQAGPLRVAVLPFRNLGADPALSFLSDGIAETVVTALGGLRDRVLLVERGQVDGAIKEIDFGQSRYVDKATAAALGRIAGAQVAVQGGYQRAGAQLRVTARFVRIETGEILDTLVLTRPAGSPFGAQDAVAAALRERLSAIAAR